MDGLFHKFKIISEKKSFKFGIPFLIFMVGGSFGLKEFTRLRYDFRKGSTFSPEDLEMLEKSGVKMKPPGSVTLESEYEKMKQEMDLDNWENIRGPRPWEEPDEKYVELVKQLEEKNQKKSVP